MLSCLTHLETELPVSSDRCCGQISDARFRKGKLYIYINLYLQQHSREVTGKCCIVLAGVSVWLPCYFCMNPEAVLSAGSFPLGYKHTQVSPILKQKQSEIEMKNPSFHPISFSSYSALFLLSWPMQLKSCPHLLPVFHLFQLIPNLCNLALALPSAKAGDDLPWC